MNTRALYFCIALFCFSLLGGAYYLQHVEKQFPCPFCILQRYAYLLIGLVSLVVLAVWQLLKASKNASCGADAVAEFVNGLPPAGWYSEYFFANGGCSDVWPPIFGVSLVVWSIICFSVLSIIGIVALKSALQK